MTENITTKRKKKKVVVPKKKRKINYLNNKDMLAEVVQSKLDGQQTDKLAKMLMLLTIRYAKRANFVNYTYREDMEGYALMSLVTSWRSFNPEKSNNPFAFFTQCIKNSFIQFLNKEKRHRDLRDELLVDSGMNPSNSFIIEYEQNRSQDDYD